MFKTSSVALISTVMAMFGHLVHTAHVNSLPFTYGLHGREPHTPSTGYSNAPSLLALVPETYSAFSSTQMKLIIVFVVFSPQVPMKLLGPARWTIIPCWHHKHWASCLSEAYCTYCLVVMDVLLKWIETKRDLILRTITYPAFWCPSLYLLYFGLSGRQR